MTTTAPRRNARPANQQPLTTTATPVVPAAAAPATPPATNLPATVPTPAGSMVRSDIRGQLQRLEDVVSGVGLTRIGETGAIISAFEMAGAIRQLRQLITTEMMADIIELRGSPLGFRTDKDSGDNGPPYNIAVVKECVIECLMRGGRIVGNEFNIIAGRAYMTKEYFTRALAELPGLTDLIMLPGVPCFNASGTGALVPFSATWIYNGRRMRIDRQIQTLEDGTKIDNRIPVKANQKMIIDAIVGKAERKMRAAIFNQCLNTTWAEADVDDVAFLVPMGSGTGPAVAPEGNSPAAPAKPGDAIADRVRRQRAEQQPETSQDAAPAGTTDRPAPDVEAPQQPAGEAAAPVPAETAPEQPDPLRYRRREFESGSRYASRMLAEMAGATTVDQVAEMSAAVAEEHKIEAIDSRALAVLDGAAQARMTDIDESAAQQTAGVS